MTLRNLPHASVLVRSQNPVSVKIRCKTLKNDVVENTVGWDRAEPDEEPSQKQLAAGRWGYLATLSRHVQRCTFWRHFVILTVNPRLRSKQAH